VVSCRVEIRNLYISPGHNFFGHYGKPAGDHPIIEVEKLECVTGRGIRGDRFFDFKDAYKGQITFFSEEVYRELCDEFELTDVAPSAARRNVITQGVDLNTLIGVQFSLQGIQFRGAEECRPCEWMDHAFAAGAHQFLKGQGGLRARILSDGCLRVTNLVSANQ
jgi:MOSC domain-containing protein YiiM